MHLTATARYALKAAVFLCRTGGAGRRMPMAEIAAGTGVPRNYLSKVLNRLVQEGVLDSARGPGGGFRLVDPTGAVPLASVIAPFGPDGRGVTCLLRDEACDVARPCVAHDEWISVASRVAEFFERTSVAELAFMRGG